MINWPCLPVGVVLPYGGKLAKDDAAPPDDLQQIKANLWSMGWLFCDGKSVSCNDYPALFGTIGYAFGGSGANFNVPDLRGQFIRGVSETGAQDPGRGDRTPSGGAGYTAAMVGSRQTDSFQEHQHYYNAPTVVGTANNEGAELPYIGTTPQPTSGYAADSQSGLPPDQSKPRTSGETRPVNTYLNYIICFRDWTVIG